jgi:hypothetical protein
MNIITTRADLDALQGTPDHDQFMAMLAGSLYRLEKDDEAKSWKAVEDDAMIQRFGFVRADFPYSAAPTLPVYVPEPVEEADPKLTGIEFEGVMCSATREDQSGLMAVLMAKQVQGAAFKPTTFFFSNGNKLVLTKDNIPAFTAVWMPFRQSFFLASES